jgi:hypothetical protein
MHRLLLRRHATTWEKKPTREPTIGSLRVAQRPTSFRGFPKLWVSARGNDEMGFSGMLRHKQDRTTDQKVAGSNPAERAK